MNMLQNRKLEFRKLLDKSYIDLKEIMDLNLEKIDSENLLIMEIAGNEIIVLYYDN